VRGFSENPACVVFSETQIIVPCTKLVQNTFPDLSFKIAGLRNSPSARLLTTEVTVTSKNGAKAVDASKSTNIAISARTLPPTEAQFLVDTPTVGATGNVTVSLTVVSPVPNNGKVLITMPKWTKETSMVAELEACEAEIFERNVSKSRMKCETNI